MARKKTSPSTDRGPSDAGGVAGRRGYKYQDHIAARFVLSMIELPDMQQVECETADDIVLSWNVEGESVSEFVQVKTTEGDKKYSLEEVMKRPIGAKPTSLIEKSLLCDQVMTGGDVRFRIVSKRDVTKPLSPLKAQGDQRSSTQLASLGAKFAKKLKTKSPNGHDLSYWADVTTWQVAGDVEGIEAFNERLLSKIAEQYGVTPNHGHVHSIYRDLLNMVGDAAEASKVKAPRKKILNRDAVLEWWGAHLDSSEAERRNSSKPYKVATEGFFTELYVLSEEDIFRALTGLDARYERKKWRSLQLAGYLATWLPEVALKPSELASVNHLNLKQKLDDAVHEVEGAISPEQLLAEVLLHCIVRHCFKSEPIACKVFYEARRGLKSFRSAHIVHRATGDQLWLGCAKVATKGNYEDLVEQVVAEIETVMDPDFLKEERRVILTLRQPRHLMPTTLEDALGHNAPLDDLLDSICVPLLIAYDSDVLGSGFSATYADQLKLEIQARYGEIKGKLPVSLKTLRVHVFLIPIECVKTLTEQFTASLHA